MSDDAPFRVLGVQQIAVGHTDKSRLRLLWSDLLGLPIVGTFRSSVENVDEDILQVGTKPYHVEIDLMQPLDASRSPNVAKPTLHHVGFWVDDLKAAVSWLTSKGVRFTGPIRKGAAGHDICFIHPKPSATFPYCGEGALIELVQAPSDLIQTFSGARPRQS